eukprot:659711-Hanusia_phi.AAC.1
MGVIGLSGRVSGEHSAGTVLSISVPVTVGNFQTIPAGRRGSPARPRRPETPPLPPATLA